MKNTITAKNILALIILFSISVNVIAQDSKLNQKAVAALDAASSNIQHYKTMKVEFSYLMENKEAKIKESRQGNAMISGDKYRINIAGQVIINDGKALYTYLPEAKEVQINDVSESDNSLSPTSLLTSYKKNYKAKFIREDKTGKTNQMHVDLIPIAGKNYFRIRVIIDLNTNNPVSFAIFDKGGSVFTYQIDKLIPDVEMNSSLFSFKPSDYPGVDIIDMR